MMFLAAAFTHLLVWSSCKLLSLDISHSPLWGTGRGLGAWEHSGAGAETSSSKRLQGKLFPASLQANVTWSCMAEGENWHPPPTLSIHSHLQQLSWVPTAAESLWCTLIHAHGSCTDPHEAAPTRVPISPRSSYMLQRRQQLPWAPCVVLPTSSHGSTGCRVLTELFPRIPLPCTPQLSYTVPVLTIIMHRSGFPEHRSFLLLSAGLYPTWPYPAESSVPSAEQSSPTGGSHLLRRKLTPFVS